MAATSVVVLDRGNNTTCTINLHGATVVSWRVNNQEQLFVSKQAVFDGKKPIRGGIPFVFPQFGPWTFGPQHGFARIIRWNLEKAPERLASGDVEAIFSLMDTDFTRSMWNYSFRLTYRLILREKELHFNIAIYNPSKDLTFSFNMLLHTYFKVPDVRRCQITGLHGSTFVDKTREGAMYQEGRDVVTICEWTDRIYQNTPQEHIITNVVSGRKMRIQKYNFPDTVVWNPWIDKAKEMSDFGDDEYPNMICIEAGHVSSPVILLPGTAFEASQILQIKVAIKETKKNMLDVWKKQFNRDKWLMRHNDRHIFFQSQWQRTEGPSIYYLVYRLMVTLYLAGTWLLTVIDPKNFDKSQEFRSKWLIYLTNWGYSICMVQSLICTICVGTWIIHGNKVNDNGTRGPPLIKYTYKLYWTCNTIAVDIAFGITVLYWALIYDRKTMNLDAQNVFVHGTNSIVMFVELCVVKHPVYFVHFYWTIFFGMVYCIFSVIYFAAGGTSRTDDPYIYNVLDWRNGGKTTAICLAVLVFLIILHCFSWCISLLRIHIHKKIYEKKSTTSHNKSNNELRGIENTAMTNLPV
ncbi:Aldose 1-epimerase [Popillia japonica]|uniref:Galactose mutarotase n=1 Tax=Popillia japonica TaxID=7064 RepID=A0AAW1MZG4_POPJA